MTDYQTAWEEMHRRLGWMQGRHNEIKEASGIAPLGLNFADVANRLIASAYPSLAKFALNHMATTPMSHRCETCGVKDSHELGCAENEAPHDCECVSAGSAEDHCPVHGHDEPAAEWGEPIPVDGKRPEWLRDDDHCRAQSMMGDWYGVKGGDARPAVMWGWPAIEQIRLPASHPYYLATSRGFTYWPGGDSAPSDWDGETVLLRPDELMTAHPEIRWQHEGNKGDVIGYRRELGASGVPIPEGTISGDFITPSGVTPIRVFDFGPPYNNGKVRCEQCLFWDNSVRHRDDDNDQTGMCRANAPKVDRHTRHALWPFTDDNDWCAKGLLDPEKVEDEGEE